MQLHHYSEELSLKFTQGNNKWVMDSDSDRVYACFFLVIIKDTVFN
jgi:hypothetical protein